MADDAALEHFIERWRRNEGGAERANYQLFLAELCDVLDLPRPDPAEATHEHNDYVFERAVIFNDEAGKSGHGRIDLYRRGSFVLEAKQSRQKGGGKEVALSPDQAALPGLEAEAARGRRSANRGWDVLMRNAREQAEQYARALPTAHGWPPFILVCDVGHAIEVFADFSGQGRITGSSRIAAGSASIWTISRRPRSGTACARSGPIRTASIRPGTRRR